MILGGLQKTSLVDFPGRVVCTVFTIGCNFRCPYCHNRDLVKVDESKLELIKEEVFFKFLEKRKNILDGVCITGGEPTLQKDLLGFCRKIKGWGLLVKVDSNGTNPEILKKLYKDNLVDFVALDYKIEWNKYADLVKTDLVKKVKRSFELVMRSGEEFEIRTTVVPGVHDVKILTKMGEDLIKISKGNKRLVWFLQNFFPNNCLDEKFMKVKPWDKEEFEKKFGQLRKQFPFVRLRGGKN
jgi:pyruvate formate lyase activating enzyme